MHCAETRDKHIKLPILQSWKNCGVTQSKDDDLNYARKMLNYPFSGNYSQVKNHWIRETENYFK